MTAPRIELTSQRQKVSRLPTEPPGRQYGHTNSKKMDPGKVANPARGQLDREKNEYFPVRVRA